MSIEPVLDFIRERFSPVEGQLLLHSLQQDPLVWQFIREEESTLAFQVAETGAKDFSPGTGCMAHPGKDVSLSMNFITVNRPCQKNYAQYNQSA